MFKIVNKFITADSLNRYLVIQYSNRIDNSPSLRTLEERHIYLLSHVSVCLGSKNQTRRETIASLEINKKGMKSVNEE